MAEHKHDWREFSRFFPLGALATHPDWLSPDGVHHPETGELIPTSEYPGGPPIAEPTPYIAFQCADPDCRHVEHVALTAAEWKKVQRAYELGAFDPDANGTHRLLSQMSLDELGLDRISAKLGDDARALSGAVESLADADGSRFVDGSSSGIAERARESTLRALGVGLDDGGEK